MGWLMPLPMLMFCGFFAPQLLVLIPFGVIIIGIVLLCMLIDWIFAEAELLDAVGPIHVLWARRSSPGTAPLKWRLQVTYSDKLTQLEIDVRDELESIGRHDLADWVVDHGWRGVASLSYAQSLLLARAAYERLGMMRLVVLIVWALYKTCAAVVKASSQWIMDALAFMIFIYGGPTPALLVNSFVFLTNVGQFVWQTVPGFSSRVSQSASDLIQILLLTYAKYTLWWARQKRLKGGNLGGRATPLRLALNDLTMLSVKFIDDMGLPEFIRANVGHTPTFEDYLFAKDTMAKLGWPVNVNMSKDRLNADAPKAFDSWRLFSTDVWTGMRQLPTYKTEALTALKDEFEVYRRTESYRTLQNELRGTARYFTKREVSGTPSLSDVWEMVGPIFRNSRLTPFSHVVNKLEKKYALGFFMMRPNGRGKLSRQSLIKQIGYGGFKSLWAKTFHLAPSLYSVAHVAIKDEALPPKKWMADKVRTIIGAPLPHYLASSVYAYWANHNFKYKETPVLIGMPLNGLYLSRVLSSHANMGTTLMGDCSDFDSTIDGPIRQMVQAVRSKGFEHHKDRDRIAALVESCYHTLANQALGHTSTGEVFRKGTGLTTGHSSTSMDNSVSLLVAYLTAWKDLTGKDASAFKCHNVIHNYGDDHLLTIRPTAPGSWNQESITKAFSRLGMTLNLDLSKRRDDILFLSKREIRADQNILNELKAAKLPLRDWVVVHDREKLLGKLSAPVKHPHPNYHLKRLMSYLTLTAHHRDIYDNIVNVIRTRKIFKQALANDYKGKIPSYSSILKAWWSESVQAESKLALAEVVDKEIEVGDLLSIGPITVWDHVANVLAIAPDVLNPALFNWGPTKYLQSVLADHLSWPFALISSSSGVAHMDAVKAILNRTPYMFLQPAYPQTVDPVGAESLLVRHWLFMLYKSVSKKREKSMYSSILLAIAKWQFTLTGFATTALPAPEWALVDTLVVALLGQIDIPRLGLDLAALPTIDFGAVGELATNWLLAHLWQSVPPNFLQATRACPARTTDSALLVNAPTGTGKSTALVAALSKHTMTSATRVVVIEPRSILVIGLVKYLSESFGLSVSGSTTNLTLDPTARVWIMTPQSFMLMIPNFKRDFLYILDEAHLDEPAMQIVGSLLTRSHLKRVFTTATPNAVPTEWWDIKVDLPIAKVWSTKREIRHYSGVDQVMSYLSLMHKVVASAVPGEKYLIYVDTPEQGEKIARSATRTTQVLSGSHSPHVLNVDIYIGTNMVDVGITIPGLTEVHCPDWEYAGNGKRYSLSNDLLTQRAGRTGRTNNGVFMLWKYSGSSTMTVKPFRKVEQSDIVSLLASGVPPSVLDVVAPDQLGQALGLQDSLTLEDRHQAVWAAECFYRNFEPLKAHWERTEVNSSGKGGTGLVQGALSDGFLFAKTPVDVRANFENLTISALRGRLRQWFEGKPLSPEHVDAENTLGTTHVTWVFIENMLHKIGTSLDDFKTDAWNEGLPTSLEDVQGKDDLYKPPVMDRRSIFK
jgi:hypothetical protein